MDVSLNLDLAFLGRLVVPAGLGGVALDLDLVVLALLVRHLFLLRPYARLRRSHFQTCVEAEIFRPAKKPKGPA